MGVYIGKAKAMRTCTKCKEDKENSEFQKDSTKKSGFKSACKKCANAQRAEYARSEHGRATKKTWRQSDAGRASRDRYNHSEAAIASRNRYEAKPEVQERRRQKAREWAEANRERARENSRKALERGRALAQQYARATGQELCVKCGTDQHLEWDHIDPATKSFSIGASYGRKADLLLAELAKCQRLCKPCHEAKTAENDDKAKGRQRTSGQ